jgi:hypothetical protein
MLTRWRAQLENAHKALSDAIAKVMALTDPNAGPATRFYYTAQFLEDTAGKVVDEGKKADRPKLVDDAQAIFFFFLFFLFCYLSI